jgi:hypothetical protein
MKYYLGGDGQKSMEGEFIDLLSSIHDIILFVIIFNIEFLKITLCCFHKYTNSYQAIVVDHNQQRLSLKYLLPT